MALDAITSRWLKERDRYIPEALRSYWRYRDIDPGWHPDNPERYRNFVRDVGHKKRGQRLGLLDPSGDFNKDNFFWSND